jgi:hypothetical protein
MNAFFHIESPVSSFNCGPGQFECVHNQTCIVSRWRCDGEYDCGDKSDEEGCSKLTNILK